MNLDECGRDRRMLEWISLILFLINLFFSPIPRASSTIAVDSFLSRNRVPIVYI